MHDPEQVFAALDLKAGNCFVDIGCGPGDYSLEASNRVGKSGLVYAVDRDQRMATTLAAKAADMGVVNIKAVAADITVSLPLDDHCADVAFMATMLHAINLKIYGDALFKEIRRLLKPGGCLAIIECKKEDQPWGPPIHIRLSPDQVREAAIPQGFVETGLVDLGKNYLIRFVRR
jgi:ubiquinone/menaquinone biosynthesis C-methylase UbiE